MERDSWFSYVYDLYLVGLNFHGGSCPSPDMGQLCNQGLCFWKPGLPRRSWCFCTDAC